MISVNDDGPRMNDRFRKKKVHGEQIEPLVNSLCSSAMSLMFVKSLNNFLMDIKVRTRERMHWRTEEK